MTKIAFFSIDMNGKTFGGKPEGEITVKNWLDKSWVSLFRCANQQMIKDTIDTFLNLSNNYSNCLTPIVEALIAAGVKIQETDTIESFKRKLEKTGKFSSLKSKELFVNGDQLKAGDILLSDSVVAIVINDGIHCKKDAAKQVFDAIAINTSCVGKGIAIKKAKKQMFLKTGPGVQYKIVKSIKRGEQVEILSETGEWFKITCADCEAGYAYGLKAHFE